jgi:hypothetical protein
MCLRMYLLRRGNRTPLLSVIFELVNIIIVLSYRLQGVHAGSSPCVGLGRPTPSALSGARKSIWYRAEAVLSCTTVDKPLVRARCLRENSLSVYAHAHDTQTDLLLHALCLTAGVVKPVVGEVELALTRQR